MYMQEELSKIRRILDANLDRAREGLRIVEEWCRFGLDDRPLTAECKDLRQELARWHTEDIRSSRQTDSDVGTAITHDREMVREDLRSVLQANFCRVQEALRVLEEYGKLGWEELSVGCKQLRYRTYILESKVLGKEESSSAASRREIIATASLYLVTSPHDRLLSVVEAALAGGLSIVQYRDKNADDKERLVLAKALRELCSRWQALFIVNDRIDIAAAVDADGVHLGQQDMPIQLAKQILGNDKIVGRSTTNPAEMQAAIAEKADYIGVGPVYETPTKAGKPAAGLDYVRYAKENATIPWFAIGGIDADNIGEVIAAGGRQVAVVRAIVNATDPQSVTQILQQRS
jgi:thiamine-phosphate pyrophosphorylase